MPPFDPFKAFGLEARWVTAPRDPALLAWLRSEGILFQSAPGGLIRFFWIGKPPKGGRPPGEPPPGQPPGGGRGRGGGGGGGGGSADLLQQYLRQMDIRGVPRNVGLAQRAIKNLVGPEEWDRRLQVAQRLTEYKDAVRGYNQVFQFYGMKPMGLKDQINFVLGRADRKYYDILEQYETTMGFRGAGFQTFAGSKQLRQADRRGLTEDLALTQKQVRQFRGRVGGDITEQDLREPLRQAARFLLEGGLGWSRIKGYGLKQSDVLDVFAGIGSAQQQEKLQRIVNEQEAMEQFRPGVTYELRPQRLTGPVGA